MKEIWKDIEGYEKLYQISNLGNIKSKSKQRKCRNNHYCNMREQNIKTHKNKHRGYMYVYLSKNGKSKSFLLHRLVAKHFIKNPNNYPVVNHIDYNKENNVYTNLEWCTQKMNVNHSRVHMKHLKKLYSTSKLKERYISKKGNYYLVCIHKYNIYEYFEELKDAIYFRDRFLNIIGN